MFKQLVEKYGVQDKVVAITFYSNQVAAMVFPEMSVGFLGTSGGEHGQRQAADPLINTNFPPNAPTIRTAPSIAPS